MYEIFLILLGIYIEQTYNLPSINNLLNKLKENTNKNTDTYTTNFIGKNFLNDFYNSIFEYSKKK